MARTALPVVFVVALATAVMARWEGVLDTDNPENANPPVTVVAS